MINKAKKEWRYVWLLGFGNCAIASVMSVLTLNIQVVLGSILQSGPSAGKTEFFSLLRDIIFLLTATQDLLDMLHMFHRITVENDNHRLSYESHLDQQMFDPSFCCSVH